MCQKATCVLFKTQISRLHTEKVLEDPAWAAPKSLQVFSAAHRWSVPTLNKGALRDNSWREIKPTWGGLVEEKGQICEYRSPKYLFSLGPCILGSFG